MSVLIRRDTTEIALSLFPGVHTAGWKSGKESSPEPNHAGFLTSDFQPPELGENTFLLIKLHSLWYFVKEARSD